MESPGQIGARIETEKSIAKKIINALISHGYSLGVDDSEEVTVERNVNPEEILGAMMTTDEDYLIVYDKPGESIGCVLFVYGNGDGTEVVNDYTVNLKSIVEPIIDGYILASGL